MGPSRPPQVLYAYIQRISAQYNIHMLYVGWARSTAAATRLRATRRQCDGAVRLPLILFPLHRLRVAGPAAWHDRTAHGRIGRGQLGDDVFQASSHQVPLSMIPNHVQPTLPYAESDSVSVID